MLALRTSAPVFSSAEGERIARDHYGLAVEASPLSGECDCNLRLIDARQQQYVLKILDNDLDPLAAPRLTAVLAHIEDTDPQLPVPRVLATQAGGSVVKIQRDGAEYSGLLMSHLSGEHLQGSASPQQLRGIGATLARIDHSLQGFFHGSLQRPLAWDLRQLPQLAQWSPYLATASERSAVDDIAQSMRSRLGALRASRSQAIHGDIHPRNLLFSAGGEQVCGVLDFGDMLHAPVIFEPAIAMAEFLMEEIATAEGAGAVLEQFARVQRVEAAEVESLFDLVAARLATTMLVHGWRSRHDPTGARALDGSAAGAWRALQELLAQGRETLTAHWHRAAATRPASEHASVAVDLNRRHRLLGGGAELFYDKPLQLVRGEGVWLFDPAGRPYLDVYNNVPHVGHAHPVVVEAIARQASLLATHTRYLHPAILDYAEDLTRGLPAGLDTCIFVNSGSEANDVAWRIAKMASGHEGALIMQHAYHGITDAVGALTPGSGEPAAPWVVTLPAQTPDGMTAAAQRAIAELKLRGFAPAAWFIDSALTSSGIFDPPVEWAAAIEREVRAAGGLIVADEVQYGLGRSGSHFWSFERRGLRPDIVTLGKPVGNGYPMGIVITSRERVEALQRKFGFFSTFGGNAVAAAAGSAVLRVLREEKLMANAYDTGEYLRAGLGRLATRHGMLLEPRGCGLLQGLLVGGADEQAARTTTRRIVNRLAAEHGILIGAEGPKANVLKMRPPMPFGRAHAEQLVAAIDAIAATLNPAASPPG